MVFIIVIIRCMHLLMVMMAVLVMTISFTAMFM